MSKKRLKILVILALLLIPGTGIAFLDFGGMTFLPQILNELIQQTYVLYDQLANLDLINSIRREIRHGVYDVLSIDVPLFEDRETTIGDIYDAASDPVGVFDDVLSLGRTRSVEELNKQINELYGALPKTNKRMFATRDGQAVQSMVHASLISDEALGFSDAGSAIWDDLDGAAESKATVRGAQAEALQVQQLANIEANQGLMISLQAQQVLGANEVGKSLTETSDAYMDMLGRALQHVEEEEK